LQGQYLNSLNSLGIVLPGRVLASGEYGEFEGSPADHVVFGTYRRTGTWSPELVAFLAGRLLRPGGGGTLLDVGANIGLISIAVAQRTRAHCLAFEPAPDNVRLLERNVQRHGLAQRIELHPVALDARPGEVALGLSDDNSGDHRLLGPVPPPPSVRRVQVRAERLDDLLAGRTLQRPCVMKLDTQGAEARVLRGAARTVAELDALVVEYWPAGLLRAGDSAGALHALLAQFPYAALLTSAASGPPQPTQALLDRLAFIPKDGSDEGFFDIALTRTA
jgi:FkbM family methyltransferase